MGSGAAATRPPEQGRRCFDQLPGTIERLLTGFATGPARDEPLLRERFDRVLLVYLDAFGWVFLERLGRHPLLDRARSDGVLVQLTSQFPSTTTAHVTTIHSGLPVAQHGVYEWHVLEPSLNRLITPLAFSYAGDTGRETLAGVLAPEAVYPDESLHGRLAAAGVRSAVAVPATIADSSTSSVLLRHAAVLPFRTPAEGLGAAAAALAADGAAYALVYLAHVDSLMHAVGPDAPAVTAAFAEALGAIAGAPVPQGTLVLVTADHGMSPVHPGRTVYVNERWPDLTRHLETGADRKPLAPAGSCRDLFLHVRDGSVETVSDELGARLGEVADVVPVAALVADGVFADPSPRLRARLADVVVLPRYGEAVYWHEPGRFVQHLYGQHGGLSPEEMEIPLLAWVA
ncbi:MAG TPA: alkaline phosphatase family protein [Gaiellaceae bacterium]|nr:alkaline phosphatase family protein [Gaiellaceae bacterium]